MPALLVGTAVAALILAAAAIAGTPSQPLLVWIDDPVSGAVVESGPVVVQMHGNDRFAPFDLFVDGTRVGSHQPTSSDGRLSTATVTWTATVGVHQLVAGNGGLRSAISIVRVVPASGAPPSAPAPPIRKSSLPPSPRPSPSAPHTIINPGGGTPRRPPSPHVTTPTPPPVSGSSTPPHLHFLPPVINDNSVDPTTTGTGECSKVLPIAFAAHVSHALTVSVEFSYATDATNTAVLSVPATDTGGLWTATVAYTAFPSRDTYYWLWIVAHGPGGTTRQVGTLIHIVSCYSIH